MIEDIQVVPSQTPLRIEQAQEINIVARCLGCLKLEEEMNELRKEWELSRTKAIARQFALNIERDMKLHCLHECPELMKYFLLPYGRKKIDLSKVNSAVIDDLLEGMTEDSKERLLRNRELTQQELEKILNILKEMKRLFTAEAHPPTNLDDDPIDEKYCGSLVLNVVPDGAELIQKQINIRRYRRGHNQTLLTNDL